MSGVAGSMLVGKTHSVRLDPHKELGQAPVAPKLVVTIAPYTRHSFGEIQTCMFFVCFNEFCIPIYIIRIIHTRVHTFIHVYIIFYLMYYVNINYYSYCKSDKL